MVQALQGSMEHLCWLQSLSLDDIGSMTALPQWVGDLISLQRLYIWNCSNLNELTQTMGRLASLQELTISDCRNLNKLPQSIGRLSSQRTRHHRLQQPHVFTRERTKAKARKAKNSY